VRLTGITDAMVAGKPEIAALWPRIVAAVGDRPVVAHNAAFDRGRLEHEVDRVAGVLPPWRWWCSAAVARRLLPERKGNGGYGLGPLAAALGVRPGAAHRALGDCLTTAGVLTRLARGRAWSEWAGEPATVWAPRAWTAAPSLRGVA
jgi:DNA polymerase-3 subunit epsilon